MLKEGVVVLADQSCSGGSGIGLQNIKECMIVTEPCTQGPAGLGDLVLPGGSGWGEPYDPIQGLC